ncbi:Ig-like domain-containing protein [Hyalangium gracile]|uniref:Ig-like domain-containing protein n=1 Tax=Hyalangium gracile TaxID=394092 RepID=UPI001CCDB3EB|nr:Ig-like domain-containing protein [Hyalangium gracile]
MPLPSFSLARLLGLGVLWLGLVVGCGGGDPKPPPSSEASPDAARSSVAVDRATGVRADGSDRVTITVTVRDASGKPLSGRTVTVEVSGGGTTVTQPTGPTNPSGVTTASVVSSQAGSKQVTVSVASDGGGVVLDEQPSIAFVAPPAVKLAFLTPSLSATAGEAVSPEVEVAIQDGLGRTVVGASAEVSLLLGAGPASAGLEGTLTANAVNGVARFPRVVLKQAGAGYRLKATSSGLADALSPTFEVLPAPPTQLVLALPASAVAGTVLSAGVTIRDAFGNVATNYRGTVRFASTAPGAVLPPDYTFTAADNGAKTFPVTLNQVGTWEVRAADSEEPALVASVPVTVVLGPATQPVLTSLPGPFEAGEEFSVEVSARDAFGNEAKDYLGTIHFTSTDPAAVLPEDYTFTEGDEGRHSFNVLFKTAATLQQLTVADTAVASLTATLGREIIPAAPSQLCFVTQPANGPVSSTLPAVRVELADAFGNRSRVAMPAVTVALRGGSAGAVLSGTLSVNPVDGLATFADLSVGQEGTGFQLTASAGALPAVDSAGFDITSALAACSDVATRSTCSGVDVACVSVACGSSAWP